MSSQTVFLQGSTTGGVAANGNGTPVSADGFQRETLVEIAETNGGTATVTLQGSLDGTNWYAAGYQQVDATDTPARSAAGISVLASTRHVYAVLDAYPQLRAVISSVATSPKVTVRAYLVQ